MPRRRAAPKATKKTADVALTREAFEVAISHLQRRLREFDQLGPSGEPVVRKALQTAWETRHTHEELTRIIRAIIADHDQRREDRLVAWLAASPERRAEWLRRTMRPGVAPSAVERVGMLMR